MPIMQLQNQYPHGFQGMQPFFEGIAQRFMPQNIQARQAMESPGFWWNADANAWYSGTPSAIRNNYDPSVNPENPNRQFFQSEYNEQFAPPWAGGNYQGKSFQHSGPGANPQDQQTDFMNQILSSILQQGGAQSRQKGGEVSSKKPKTQNGTNALSELMNLMNLEKGEVPVVAHEGEYILNSDAVDMIGEEALNRLNQMGNTMPRYQEGGLVNQMMMGQADQSPPEPNAISDPLQAMQLAEQYGNNEALSRAYLQRAQELRSGGGPPQNSYVQQPPSSPNSQQSQPQRGPASRTGQTTQDQAQQASQQGDSALDQRREARSGAGDRANQAAQAISEFFSNFITPAPGLTNGIDPQPGDSQAQDWQGRTFTPSQNQRERNMFGVSGTFPDNTTQPQQEESSQQQAAPPQSPPPEGSGSRNRSQPEDDPQKRLKKMPAPQQSNEPQQQQMAPQQQELNVGYRQAGQPMGVDWQALGQMDPFQAMSALQQYADTQGQFYNGPQFGPQGNIAGPGNTNQSQNLMAELMNQYLGGMQAQESRTGQQATRAQTSGQQLQNRFQAETMDDRTRQLKLQVDKLAAQEPYWSDIARAELNNMRANTRNALEQAAYSAERSRSNRETIMAMSPADMIGAIQSGQDLRQSYIDQQQELASSATEYAKQDGSNAAKKIAALEQLKLRMLTGAVGPTEDTDGDGQLSPADMTNEQIREMGLDTGGGIFAGAEITDGDITRVKSEVMQMQTRLNQADQIQNAFASGMGLFGGGAGSGTNYQQQAQQMQTGQQGGQRQ